MTKDTEALREAAFRIANMHMLAVGASLSTFDERARYVQRLADEIAALATPASDVVAGGEALRDALVSAACDGIADDYMTSEKHHPGYVLIPSAKFEAILAALKGPAA